MDDHIQQLLELARSSDQTERMEAAYLIGELEEIPQELLAAIYELIHDEFIEVQTTANETLKKILMKQYPDLQDFDE